MTVSAKTREENMAKMAICIYVYTESLTYRKMEQDETAYFWEYPLIYLNFSVPF